MLFRPKRSLVRTTLLGVAALGTLIWAAESQLGVGVNTLLAQLILLLLALLITVLGAGLVFALFKLLTGRGGRGRDTDNGDTDNGKDADREASANGNDVARPQER